jgi:hypothetical protein
LQFQFCKALVFPPLKCSNFTPYVSTFLAAFKRGHHTPCNDNKKGS